MHGRATRQFSLLGGASNSIFCENQDIILRPVSTSGHGLMLRRRPIPGAYVAVLAALAVAARCGALPDSADWKDIQAQPCNLGLQDKYGRVRREKARVRESSAVS